MTPVFYALEALPNTVVSAVIRSNRPTATALKPVIGRSNIVLLQSTITLGSHHIYIRRTELRLGCRKRRRHEIGDSRASTQPKEEEGRKY